MLPIYIKINAKVWFYGIGEACTILYIDDNHIDDIDCYWAGIYDDGVVITASFKDSWVWYKSKDLK